MSGVTRSDNIGSHSSLQYKYGMAIKQKSLFNRIKLSRSKRGLMLSFNHTSSYHPLFVSAQAVEMGYYIYLLTNSRLTVIYTGITNNLIRRVYEHKHKLVDGFTRRYNVDKLVYYETYLDASSAISREKQIKSWSRDKKCALIERMNSDWNDLYDELIF